MHVQVVSERLGHANVSFTMNVYQQVLPGMRAEAADAFSQTIHNARSKDRIDTAATDDDDDDPTDEADG